MDVLDPGAYAAAEASNPGFDPQRYHHLLAIVGRERGVPGKELEHHRLGGGTEGDTLGYEYARGNLREARAQALSLAEILRLAQADRELPWAPYTSMSAHGRVLLAPYLLMPWKRPHGTRDLHAIQRFSEVVDALAQRPLRGVQYIRQVATARRFRLLLDSLIAPGAAPELEGEILDLYGSLADLAGYVSSYRDFAIARLLRVRYADRARRAEMLDDANDLIRRSGALAALVGDATGVRRARRMRAYLRLAGAFWTLPLPPAAPPPSGVA